MSENVQRYVSGGVFREFIDGVLRREQPKRDGIARWWHANGTLARECTMVDGKVHGTMRQFHKNGRIAREEPYENGIINGTVTQWNAEGKLLGQYEMKNGRGVKREWKEDGSLRLEFEQVTENASKGRVWDDLGKVREVFLWNGKPISKKKFCERLAREEADS